MAAEDHTPIKLEPARDDVALTHDARRQMPEPPPVRLMSVADVHLLAATGVDEALDAFYVDLFHFGRLPKRDGNHRAYAAENFDLIFDLTEPPVKRDSVLPTPIEVPSIGTLREQLLEREIEYEALRGVIPTDDYLLIKDPAGNFIAVRERRGVS